MSHAVRQVARQVFQDIPVLQCDECKRTVDVGSPEANNWYVGTTVLGLAKGHVEAAHLCSPWCASRFYRRAADVQPVQEQAQAAESTF